jgi:hypothetical protein
MVFAVSAGGTMTSTPMHACGMEVLLRYILCR